MRYKIICRTDAINKSGEAPLYLLFSHNNRRKKVATGVVISPQFWNDSAQQILPDCPNRHHALFNITSSVYSLNDYIQSILI